MSCCLQISRSSTHASQEKNTCLLSHPLTKVALFVISFLAAAAAVVSHFTVLGIPGIIAFSTISAVSLTAFIMASLCQTRARYESDASKLRKEKIPEQTPEKPIAELLQALPNLVNANDDVHIPVMSAMQNAIIKTCKQFVEEKATPEIIIDWLQNNINQLKIEQIKTFVLLFIGNCDYLPTYTASLLESTQWQDPLIKERSLIEFFSDYLALSKCVELSIEPEASENKKPFNAYLCSVHMQKIIGSGDFVLNPIAIPGSLMQAIGLAIQRLAITGVMETQQIADQNDEIAAAGLSLSIQPTANCRFPASFIKPLLPHLAHLPGLVKLNLSDGDVPITDGFKNADLPGLKLVIRTNLLLTELLFNAGGISQKMRDKIQKRLEYRKAKNIDLLKEILCLKISIDEYKCGKRGIRTLDTF